MRAKLAIVADGPGVVDITMLLRGEIIVRDWRSVHVAGDRSKPIDLPDSHKRRWRA